MKLHANVFDTAAYMHCFTQQRVLRARSERDTKMYVHNFAFRANGCATKNIQGEQESQLIANEILFFSSQSTNQIKSLLWHQLLPTRLKFWNEMRTKNKIPRHRFLE